MPPHIGSIAVDSWRQYLLEPVDIDTTTDANIFNSSKTNVAFHDVGITLTPPVSSGGLSTMAVQYQGVVQSGHIQYLPTYDQTLRMKRLFMC